MHRHLVCTPGAAGWRLRAAAGALAAALASAPAWAQTPTAAHAAAPTTSALPRLFEAAWARQPEAQALAARREAVQARQQAVQAWTPEPPALLLSHQTDRLGSLAGAQVLELGVALPLWLPGERSRSQALVQAEGQALESQAGSARLRLAGQLREAWWQWQLARAEAEAAHARRDSLRRLADDVALRVQAGELARADQHQAEGAVAAAEVAQAQAEGALMLALQGLRALADGLPDMPAQPDAVAEPEPLAAADSAAATADGHAELRALLDRRRVADDAAALVAAQTRANPELSLSTSRERTARGEAPQHSLTVALRWPFGGGAAHGARLANVRADALALQAELALQRQRLAAERDSAQGRTVAARSQLAAAQRRAQLAEETRGFFDKSFRLGQTDLPTRLRIEAEAADAQRQAARARLELAAAISAWRQALGLLPQ